MDNVEKMIELKSLGLDPKDVVLLVGVEYFKENGVNLTKKEKEMLEILKKKRDYLRLLKRITD